MSIRGPHKTVGITDEWLTPPVITSTLGPFDLDPCAPIQWPGYIGARERYTVISDGLAQDWGRAYVFCNPPYSQIEKWMEKMAAHNNGIALVFARTDTSWFHNYVWRRASGILFLRGRITFHLPSGAPAKFNAGGPSCLIAYGPYAAARLKANELNGYLVRL